MAKKRLHEVAAEHQKKYERETRLQYGTTAVNESNARWDSYTSSQQDFVLEESGRVGAAILEAMKAGKAVDDAEVQELTQRWHETLRYFYEPTLEILRGLGELYTTDADFIAFFAKAHPDFAVYMKGAIDHYVDELETAEIARMLEEDKRQKRLGL